MDTLLRRRFMISAGRVTPPTPSRLPDGYTEVEYIQFNAAQLVDTLLVPTNNWRIVADWSRGSSSAMYLYGAMSSGNTLSCTAYLQTGGTGNWRWKNRYAAINPSVSRHTSTQDNTGVTLDGVHTNYNGSVSGFTAPVSLTIGTSHAAGGTYNSPTFIGNIYSFQIYVSDVLKMDLVPCTNPQSVPGFYDIVGESFYSSLSGTPLIAGPAI